MPPSLPQNMSPGPDSASGRHAGARACHAGGTGRSPDLWPGRPGHTRRLVRHGRSAVQARDGLLDRRNASPRRSGSSGWLRLSNRPLDSAPDRRFACGFPQTDRPPHAPGGLTARNGCGPAYPGSSWRGAPAPSQHGHCRQHGPQNDPPRGSRRPVLLRRRVRQRQVDAKAAGQALASLTHQLVVVPAEHRPGNRREQAFAA
jgi:hypothetical protein